MASLLKWRPSPTEMTASAICKNGDFDGSIEYSYSYSFALEYNGPALSSSDIPQARPIDIDRIPTATPIPGDDWVTGNAALPIIYPIPLRKTKKPNSVSDDDDEDDASSSSSNYFSGEGDLEGPCHVRKPSIVTFQSPDSGEFFEELSIENVSPDLIILRKPRIEHKIPCHRCLRGNRFTDKESCLVCNAKYCYDCVLRAMGTMPEGRKCIVCIGFRIDESRRNSLGKASKMLKKLFAEEEVKRILTAEVSCALNQLPPNAVYVNDEPLDEAALQQLQSCPNPPRKLKPGFYWYDKVSGLWGKVGHKPDQIISSQLKVGGQIRRESSNGNTGVLINNREITKQEALMLKLAGIQCEGKPELLVTEDGSYSEVGQKNIRGKIWEKTTTRAFCKVISLPLPPITSPESREKSVANKPEKCLRELLLLGYDKCGTSTIFKQAKLSNHIPFTEDECENIKVVIQRNLYEYMAILLEACDNFAKERSREKALKAKGKALMIDEGSSSSSNRSTSKVKEDETNYLISSRLQGFSDWLLKVIESDNLEAVVGSATCDYAPLVEELWADGAIQATYNRRNEIGKLPRVATYFLQRAIEISREDYAPSEMDMLYAEGISKGLASMEFSLPKFVEDDRCDLEDRSQLIRVPSTILHGSCKWLSMFENIRMVLFCVSLPDYDEIILNEIGSPINKMIETRNLFQKIVTDPCLSNKHFLLILNKFDLFEEKIEQVPLNHCDWFHDFNPVTSTNPNSTVGNPMAPLGQRGFHYIAMKFKRLFWSLTERKLFVSLVTGMERDSVHECLRYAREILKWEEEEEMGHANGEESSASIEASSTS